MYKDKSKLSDSKQFSFNNTIKLSQKATPQSSNNVSFQHHFGSTLKNFYTEPYNMLKDSNYPNLFNNNNKENQFWRRIQSYQLHNDSSQHQNQSIQKNMSTANRNISKKSINKTSSRPSLIEKTNNLLNIHMDLVSNTQKKEQPIKHLKRSASVTSKKNDDSLKRDQNIKVYIRLKPKSKKQINSKQLIQILNEQTIKIEDNYFCFDQIFNQSVNQQQLFKQVGLQMCQKMYQGFNGTIFAYGQTGSGKTYTIFGEQTSQTHGLIYRCIREILQNKQKYDKNAKIKCSMVQLYKQQLIDMFGSCNDLKLKENKNGEVYIQGLKQVYIKDQSEMINLVRQGAKGRKVTSTKLNEESSRSHTILTIYLQLSKYTTKLCLIDLAGSQKVCKSGTQGQAFEQTKKINYSLSCLGNVINALTTRSRFDHIPFRDSKLTRLLKDSLTGNFLTSIIVNCSTSDQFANQTISSLKFAQRAKKIKINVQSLEEQINQKQSIFQLHQIIKKLQYDLELTTNELKKYKEQERQKQKSIKKSKVQNNSSTKKILINIPLRKIQNRKENIHQKQNERCNTYESDNTARNPIPSQRAYVQQNIKKYKQKVEIKPPIFTGASNLNAHDFSSLNVSKSIKKLQNSPDISSLQFKYDQSPDLSLSFSIQGESARRQLFLNSPS